MTGLSLIQSAALLGIFAARVDLTDLGWDIYPKLLGAIFLASLGGMSMGLLVSAVVRNSDWAMALVPLIIIPQLLFAGALVPLEAMSWPAEGLAHLTMTKWSLELTGSMTELASRFEAVARQGFELPYRNVFDINPWGHWAALTGFVLAMLGATALIQKRKDRL